MAPPQLIKEGDTVIFDENGERLSIIKVKDNGMVRIGKARIAMAQFVGLPFGAAFNVQPDGSLDRIKECPITEWAQGQITATDRSNDTLFDRNTDNQKLSADDIQAMKQEGKAGQDIIEALCSNSATFQSKTEFSQEKYKRKKAKKYLLVLTLRRPTARLLCQAHYDKGPERVANLRPDSLAIMLSLANVAAGAQVLVIDGCVGVVTAGVVERMGGVGCVMAAYVEGNTATDAAKSLNLGAEQLACLHTCSLATLHELKAQAARTPSVVAAKEESEAANGVQPVQGADDVMDVDAPGATQPPAAGKAEPQQEAEPTSNVGGAGGDGGAASSAAAPPRHSASRQHALAAVSQTGFSSCIMAAPKYDVISLMQQVLPLLRPSATFVIFSAWPHPLAECLTYLQITRQAVLLQLQESWLRPYQVLPARTHPHMMCAGSGGFILSGIKVVPPVDVPPHLPPNISWTSAAPLAQPDAGVGMGRSDAGAAPGEQQDRGGRGGNRGGRHGAGGSRGGGRGGRYDGGGNRGGRSKRGRHD